MHVYFYEWIIVFVTVRRDMIWQDEDGTCPTPTLYVSSYFGVLSVTTGMWYLPVGRWGPSFFTREAGSWIATNSELSFDSLEKNPEIFKYLRAYWGSCYCWSLYFGNMEDCSFCRFRWSTGLPKLWNRRSSFSSCFILFPQFSRCGRIFLSIIVV